MNRPMDPYTHSEKTDLKYTVGQAVESAKRRLKGIRLCTNAITNRSLKEPITLKELNEISDELYNDSVYYADAWR